MSTVKKFSSQMDEAVFNKLKELSKETNADISILLTEAVTDLINKKGLRPAFRIASDEIMSQYDEALSELAK